MCAEDSDEQDRATAWQAFPGTEQGRGRALRRWAWILPLVWSGLRHLVTRTAARASSDGRGGDWQIARGSFADRGHRGGAAGGASLRLICWNIAYGRRYARIVRTLREHAPADVYLLQEVDSGCRRSRRRDVARCLARELGLEYVFGVEFCELAEGLPGRPGLHGQAILSRFPLEQVRLLRFAHQAHDWSTDPVQPRRGGRMALVSELTIGHRRVLLYNTHLESRGDPAGRARQLDEIVADVCARGGGAAVVIAGDLNTRRGASAEQPAGYLARHPVFGAAARAAVARLGGREIGANWFLVRGARAALVPLDRHPRASDHEPLALDLWLEEGE